MYDGLEASSQNRWPSLEFDLMAVNSLFAPLLGAGFYYKTFMWPAAFWEKVYEPLIRRAAGLGRASRLPDPDTYEQAYAFCDVLVIGAGPAGLAAALAAGRAGARVILCDEDAGRAGACCAERCEIGGEPGHAWADAALAELEGMPRVRVMPRSTVFGVYDGGTYAVVERVTDHLPVPSAAPAAPALVAHRGEARGAGGRRYRAADRVRAATTGRASCWRPPCALRQPLRGGARQARRGVHRRR